MGKLKDIKAKLVAATSRTLGDKVQNRKLRIVATTFLLTLIFGTVNVFASPVQVGDNAYGIWDQEAETVYFNGTGALWDVTATDTNLLRYVTGNQGHLVKHIVIEGISSLGSGAFRTGNMSGYHNTAVETIHIGPSVEDLGSYNFSAGYGQYNTTGTVIITGMEGVKTIGFRTFSGMNENGNTRKIIFPALPESLHTIGGDSFSGLYYTNTLTNLATSPQNIGNWAFLALGVYAGNGAEINVYAYESNSTFITTIQNSHNGWGSTNTIKIETPTGTVLDPAITSLQDWVNAGNDPIDWVEGGGSVEQFITNGGSTTQWFGWFPGTYYWFRGGGSSSLFLQGGGSSSMWVSQGGSASGWQSMGGSVSDWQSAGGSAQEFQQMLEEEEALNELIKIFVNNGEVNFPDVKPKWYQSSLLVPIRFIYEMLGIDVYWDDVQNKVVLDCTPIGQDRVLELWPNRDVFAINGKLYPLGAAPVIENGRLLLPAQYVVKALDTLFYKQEQPSQNEVNGLYFVNMTAEQVQQIDPTIDISKFTDIPPMPEYDRTSWVNINNPEDEIAALIGVGDSADIILIAHPTSIMVVLPFKLLVDMGSDGTIVVGLGYQIINQSVLGQLEILEIEVEGLNGWTLVDIEENFSIKSKNVKELGVSINGSKALNGKVELNEYLKAPIPNGGSKLLSPDVKLPFRKVNGSEYVVRIRITIGVY